MATKGSLPAAAQSVQKPVVAFVLTGISSAEIAGPRPSFAPALCADWKEKPSNACDRFDKTGDTVTVLDAASGQARASLLRCDKALPTLWCYPLPCFFLS